TGYNKDMVVEAGAPQAGTISGATTASTEAGTANTGRTWYEQGYVPNALATGLPAAGSTITNAAASDHTYTLAASYTANNAVLVDSIVPSATLTPTTPTTFSALSFLGAAANGSVTNDCITAHLDGSYETNRFVMSDWMNNSPIALSAA